MEPFVWPEPPRQVAFPIARPGYGLIGAAAFVALVLALIGWAWPAVVALATTLAIAGFFRDPDRVIPQAAHGVVSPADGKVVAAGPMDHSPVYGGPCVRVSVFMSVFNVHVNRAPIAGRVTRVDYHPGKFIAANLDKSSDVNERNAVTLESADGERIVVVQIAGLIARRIICGLSVGHEVGRGQRYGMICFGSRLDVFLPPGARLDCQVGDRVQAGTSILGYLK
ncbi:MAG: phosphatidylserine decarboxylase family protein [Desulfobacterales bacterium]|jgi:phosphatidylserine decarboxylase|nr:phosphatidylserine decarboxylase family protein [Desulfobacteraceae bacterium]MDD3991531.1 phosphatidylserine decarboxylase family protein [Desulfobacteraceae bacterium]MDY0312178.1 phosphatidylserine decarboxylase family protein [Desulfobacterales bacterium]